MSKQHRTAGVSFKEITIAEKTYRMRPLTLGDYAEMEAYVVSLRVDPFAAVANSISHLTKEQQLAAWDAAVRVAMQSRIVTTDEMSRFEKSIEGVSWKLWKCLEEDHPEIDSVHKAAELLRQAGEKRLGEIVMAIHIGSGEADAGKSNGRGQTAMTDQDLDGP